MKGNVKGDLTRAYTKLDPLQIIKPSRERMFTFSPSSISGEDSTNVDIRKQHSPYYGLNIIDATHNFYTDDREYSFVGLLDNEIPEHGIFDNDNITLGNLHMNKKSQQYWKNRIENTPTQQNNGISKNSVEYIFNKLINDKEISLTGLCKLFRFLGYDNIFIYDPTCRHCPSVTNAIHDMSIRNNNANIWKTNSTVDPELYAEELIKLRDTQLSVNNPRTTRTVMREKVKSVGKNTIRLNSSGDK